MGAKKITTLIEYEDPRDLRERWIHLHRQKAELKIEQARVDAEIEVLESSMQYEKWLRQIPTKDVTHYDETPLASDERLHNVADVCNRFDRAKNWVYKQVREGELRPVKALGTPYRFKPAELDRFEKGWKRRRE